MALTYAIGDLHGRMDILQKMEFAIWNDFSKRHEHHENAPTVVLLGDFIDRGLQSRQVIDFLTDSRNNQHLKRVVLRGNHEEMMLEIYEKRFDTGLLHWWIGNGGGQTLFSYNSDVVGKAFCEIDPVKIIRATHIDWLKSLPYCHEDKYRVYVHAYVDPTIPLDQQSFDKMTWTCWPSGSDLPSFEGKHIVHGHEQEKDGPILLKNRTNIDTWAWRTGRGVVAVFDDDVSGGPIDIIEVRA